MLCRVIKKQMEIIKSATWSNYYSFKQNAIRISDWSVSNSEVAYFDLQHTFKHTHQQRKLKMHFNYTLYIVLNSASTN